MNSARDDKTINEAEMMMLDQDIRNIMGSSGSKVDLKLNKIESETPGVNNKNKYFLQ